MNTVVVPSFVREHLRERLTLVLLVGIPVFFVLIFAVGIAQNPMFGDGTPPDWAALLPAYGPVRMMVDGAFSPSFHGAGALAIAIAGPPLS